MLALYNGFKYGKDYKIGTGGACYTHPCFCQFQHLKFGKIVLGPTDLYNFKELK